MKCFSANLRLFATYCIARSHKCNTLAKTDAMCS